MKQRIQMVFKISIIALCLLGIQSSVSAQIIQVKSIVCKGDSTGQIGVFPNFGTAPYAYNWSNGLKTQSIDGLKAGVYTVTVTDNAAKDSISSFVLTEPAKLTNTIVAVPNSFWPKNNGKITITPKGGSGWITYSMYDSIAQKPTQQPNSVFSNLASGTYYLVTIDLYGCKKYDTVRIAENAALKTTVDVHSGLSNHPAVVSIDTTACYRKKDTPVIVKPDTAIMKFPVTITFDDGKIFTYIDTTYRSGGPYIVGPGDTVSQFVDVFKPGFHMVTITDANNKGFRYSWTVDTVLADISLTWTQTNNPCYGDKNGQIIATAKGGWNNFTYNVAGVPSNIASGLAAGPYTILATDFTGCSATQSVLIKQPDQPLHIVFDTPTAATCLAAKNGSVSVNRVDGFTGNVSYSWKTGQTTQAINSLFSAKYYVAVTDGLGCKTNDSIFVGAGLGATGVVFDEPKHASCPAAHNGMINVNRVDGAVYPVSYLWSTGLSSKSISNLFSGIYRVTITDINNCSIVDSAKVDADKGIVGIVFDDPTPVTCPTAKNGFGKINRVDGATQPLQYIWSNGITDDGIDSVVLGKYFVTVTDINNCAKSDSIVIAVSKEPFQIFFDIPVNARCPFSNDGLLSIHHIEGFTNPVSYVWSNGVQASTIDSLAIGTYRITVTDVNTCKQIDSIEVRSDKKACVFNVITPNNDGYNDYFDISDLCMGMNKKAEIFNENGKMIAKLDDNNPRWNGIDPSLPPNGPSSAFTVFIEVYNNTGKIYKKWAETISVIYAK